MFCSVFCHIYDRRYREFAGRDGDVFGILLAIAGRDAWSFCERIILIINKSIFVFI